MCSLSTISGCRQSSSQNHRHVERIDRECHTSRLANVPEELRQFGLPVLVAVNQALQHRAQDGEVESFQLLSIEEVARLVSQTQEFKPNCAVVITVSAFAGSLCL